MTVENGIGLKDKVMDRLEATADFAKRWPQYGARECGILAAYNGVAVSNLMWIYIDYVAKFTPSLIVDTAIVTTSLLLSIRKAQSMRKEAILRSLH